MCKQWQIDMAIKIILVSVNRYVGGLTGQVTCNHNYRFLFQNRFSIFWGTYNYIYIYTASQTKDYNTKSVNRFES